jgi:hypothetical protein
LAREIARRGWTLADLARAAGLSGATLTAAKLAGRFRPARCDASRRRWHRLRRSRASTISFLAERQPPASIAINAS